MNIIFKNEYGNRAVIYGFLTDDDVAILDNTLDENHVIISHVGDGEYSHNIFGNVFSNYSKALKSFNLTFQRQNYKTSNKNLVCIIQKTYMEKGTTEYYVGYVSNDYKDVDKVYPQLEGRLTVERLNSAIWYGGH
jgi:hypothetical protein